MARPKGSRKKSTEQVDADLDLDDDFLSDEDYFIEGLRAAVARAQSSRLGGVDLYDGLRTGGMDSVQTDFAE